MSNIECTEQINIPASVVPVLHAVLTQQGFEVVERKSAGAPGVLELGSIRRGEVRVGYSLMAEPESQVLVHYSTLFASEQLLAEDVREALEELAALEAQ